MSDVHTNTPSAGVRVLLVLLSIVLCICLFVSLLTTALIADVRLLTSKGGLEKIVTSLIIPQARPSHRLPLTAAMGSLRVAESNTGDQTADALISWLYDALKSQHGEELAITEEQMNTFLENSTAKEFLIEKTASYMSDFINGTDTTTISSEELKQLIDENSALIESTFGIAVTEDIQDAIVGFVDEVNLDQVIKTEVIGPLADTTIPGYTPQFYPSDPNLNSIGSAAGYTVSHLMADIRTVTSTAVLIICIVICVLLVTALFFTNRMRLPGTLVCAGVPALIAGILLVIPTVLLQALPGLLDSAAAGAISTVIGVIAPIHYGLLGLGVALIVAAIVVKIILTQKQKPNIV